MSETEPKPKKTRVRAPKVHMGEEQKKALVEGVIENYDVLYGSFSEKLSFTVKNKKWEQIAERVNSLGTEKFDRAMIKKRWEVLKSAVKAKAQAYYTDMKKTGSGVMDEPSLTPIEELVFAFLKTKPETIMGVIPDGDTDEITKENIISAPSGASNKTEESTVEILNADEPHAKDESSDTVMDMTSSDNVEAEARPDKQKTPTSVKTKRKSSDTGAASHPQMLMVTIEQDRLDLEKERLQLEREGLSLQRKTLLAVQEAANSQRQMASAIQEATQAWRDTATTLQTILARLPTTYQPFQY